MRSCSGKNDHQLHHTTAEQQFSNKASRQEDIMQNKAEPTGTLILKGAIITTIDYQISLKELR